MTIDWSAVQAANTFGAGPTSGGDAVPTMRKIVYGDLDASVRAALLADILCNIGQAFPQWLGYALQPFSIDGAVIGNNTWVDRPPGFEFVTGMLPRLSRISGTGVVTVDIKFGSTGGSGGTSIFSTLLTMDANELTSTTAAVQAVLSTTTHTDDQEMSVILTDAALDSVGVILRMPVYWTVFS